MDIVFKISIYICQLKVIVLISVAILAQGARRSFKGKGALTAGRALGPAWLPACLPCPAPAARLPALLLAAWLPAPAAGDVFIVVSNSGETFDSVESLRLVQRSAGGKEVLTVGVVYEAESTIGKVADALMQTFAGVEAGVASTKVFSCTVLNFVLLAIALGEACGTLQEAERKTLMRQLEELPALVQEVIELESRALKMQDSPRSLVIGECILWDISCQNVLAQNFIFLGRGCNFPIALEGAMKCKDTAYIHAEGSPAAEMKHGPIALIDQFMPVVVIAPQPDPCYEKIKANFNEVATRSGSIIAITDTTNNELGDLCEYVIRVPPTHELLMPLVAVIPMPLLAYMMGILKGNEAARGR